LRNHEHFQFYTDFLTLLRAAGVEKLQLQPLIDAFLVFYNQEAEALKKIAMSYLTKKIREADARRSVMFRGMADANKSALNHFEPETGEAARRMQVVFRTYGNLAQKPLAEKTAAIHNLLKELAENHAADMAAVGLGGWAEELRTLNGAVERLMVERVEEAGGRPAVSVKAARIRVDGAYRNLTLCIEAFSVAETGEAATACAGLIANLNALAEQFGRILAVREGRSEAHASQAEK